MIFFKKIYTCQVYLAWSNRSAIIKKYVAQYISQSWLNVFINYAERHISCPPFESGSYLLAFVANVIRVSVHGKASRVIIKPNSRCCDGFALVQPFIFQPH